MTHDNDDFPALSTSTPPALRTRLRAVLIIAIVVLVLVGLVFIIRRTPYSAPANLARPGQRATGPGGQGSPTPVTVATAALGDIEVRIPALGTVTPLATVTVRTQISGILQKIAFIEGQLVRQGEMIAEIDPRPYEAAVEQTEGNLKRDQALLADAKLDLKRYEGLVKEDSIAVQQLDTQRALVDQYEGTIQSDQGQLKTAQVNLIYTRIVSPVNGRVGLRQVDQGNYVTPGDANGIVVINQLQPISVIFPIPEDNVPALMQQLRDGGALKVDAFDRTNSAKLAEGKLLTLDNQIDITTGTVKLRALFDNADGSLFPNQFVNVQLLQDVLQAAGHHAEFGGAPRRAQRRRHHLRLCREAGRHRLGAARDARRRRWRARRSHRRTRGRRRRGDRRRRPAAGRRRSNAAAGVARRRRPSASPGRRSRQEWRAGRPGPAPQAAARKLTVNPSRIFILRPVATTLLMVAILIVGAIAYQQLPLSALPEVAYPTIQVQTFYPGASPEVITSAITAPLEKQFGQMPGLNEMSSTSSGGASVITLQFSLSLAIDVAEQEVQAAISAAQNLLPQDLPAPPIYAKVNPADAPVLTLGITSKVMPLTDVEDLADTRIAQKISQLKGVGVVSISGGQRPAVRVVVNPRALAAYGLNLDDLRTTISNANQNGPKGTLDGPKKRLYDQHQRSDQQRR